MIETLKSIIIRKAEVKDKEVIRLLIREFYFESLFEYNISFDRETLNETMQNFIDNQLIFLAEKNGKSVGIIAGIVIPSMFDKSQKIAQEVVWYVSEEYRKGTVGIKLVKWFWKACKELGVEHIIMGSIGNLMSDVLDKFYKKNGYKKMETYYIKEV